MNATDEKLIASLVEKSRSALAELEDLHRANKRVIRALERAIDDLTIRSSFTFLRASQ